MGVKASDGGGFRGTRPTGDATVSAAPASSLPRIKPTRSGGDVEGKAASKGPDEAARPAAVAPASAPIAPVAVAPASAPVAPVAVAPASAPIAPVAVAPASAPAAPAAVAPASAPVAPVAVAPASAPAAPVAVAPASAPIVPVAVAPAAPAPALPAAAVPVFAANASSTAFAALGSATENSLRAFAKTLALTGESSQELNAFILFIFTGISVEAKSAARAGGRLGAACRICAMRESV